MNGRILFTQEWGAEAACPEEPELFFASGSDQSADRQRQRAKAICQECVVIDPCLEYALDRREEFGIWGGLDEDERRQIIANRQLRKWAS